MIPTAKPAWLTGFIQFWMVVSAWSQETSLAGRVSCGNRPLAAVTISLKGTAKGAVTDSLGFYRISGLAAGQYKMVASALGYVTAERLVNLGAGSMAQVDINLAEKDNSLNEVVISATLREVSKLESPVPVEVYTKSFFRANPTPSIFESLQNINGVRPQLNCNICNTGDIHINGLEGPYTMVMIDGMPVISGLSTVYGLTGIPQSLVERMEIVKGPASTLYGSEAVGGLINIITKTPDKSPAFSADVFSSTWADLNADLGMKFHVGKKINSLAGINYFHYGNPVDNNGDGFTDLTLQNRISVFSKWNIDRRSGRIFSVAGRYVHEDRWGGDMRWNKQFRGGDSLYGESIYTRRWEMGGNYQLPMRGKTLLQISLNGHEQDSYYGTVPYMASQYIAFGQLLWFEKVNTHELLAGAAYRYTWYDDNTPATAKYDSANTATNQPYLMKLPGIFLQDEWKISPQHTLLAGLRYDHNSIHGNVLTPRISYKFSSEDRENILRLSLGNGYRVANVFTEDHAALTGARKVVFASALEPETSWNGNINFVKKIHAATGFFTTLDATAFYTRFSNRIIPDYQTDPNLIIYDNLDGFAESKGISLNIDLTTKKGFNAMVGGTFMDVSYTEQGVKKRQMLTERYTVVWNIGYSYRKAGITIDYTGNLYGPMLLPLLGPLDDRSGTSPAWSLQNIQVTKKFPSGFDMYAGIKNLLNFTPPAYSIARPFDPFDKQVVFDANGQVVPTPDNPHALTFDPSYVYAPNQGRRAFLGFRYTLNK